MKRIALIIAIVAAGFAAKAHHLNSQLELTIRNHELFTVVIDNRYFNQPDDKFVFTDLEPGNHYLQVVLHMFRRGWQHTSREIFSETIFIPAATVIIARIDRGNHLKIVREEPLFIQPVVNCPAPPPVPQYQWISQQPMPMADCEFEQFRNSVACKSFESTKLQIIKQVMAENYFTTRQVIVLMNELWFESSKVELAKFAYQHTLDKQKYFLVNDTFIFSSSIDELDRYLHFVNG